MYFNSLEFLGFFSVLVLLYWSLFQKNIKARNLFLLAVSYLFYAYWDWRFLSLIVTSSAVDFFVAQQMEDAKKPSDRKKWLWLSIAVNLGVLFSFKYFDFFAHSFAAVLTGLGLEAHSLTLNVVLPVGISFYTFQTLGYSLDVNRKKVPAERDPIAFFAFVSFFPQLIAGPIERAQDLLPQFREKAQLSPKEATEALRQVAWGLFKKVAIADQLANTVHYVFDGYATLSGAMLWLGAFYFTVQIYCDFSGYSDIAIGLARLLGFKLSPNFRYPYFSRSFRAFWRRWHITLSTWFRDYVYIPLGGSRSRRSRIVFNVLVTFILSGFWHGAQWHFIVWGALNGIYLLPGVVFQQGARLSKLRLFYEKLQNKGLSIPLVFLITMLTWVFFRSDTTLQAFEYLHRMFTTSWTVPNAPRVYPLLWIGLLLGVEVVMSRSISPFAIPSKWPMLLRWGVYLVLCLSIARFFTIYQTFLYFQF